MYSKIAFWAGAVALVLTSFLYPKWKMGYSEATLSWDVSGYYLYLPAYFIYDDPNDLAFFPAILDTYGPTPSLYQAFDHESGTKVMKYSCGMAVAYSPFFFLGHAYAGITDYPQDGFSLPYQAAISWGSLLIALIGLWLARSNLLHFFSDRITAASLILLVLGTNYLPYAGISNAMSHNYLFTLYSLLIFLTIRWYKNPDYGKSLAIGLCLGLMALIRPTEIIAALIPLLWGFRPNAIPRHLKKWSSNWKMLALAILACGLMGSLQLIYWKSVTGDWIVYSYQDQGFSWLHPYFMEVLFSYRKGWLVYTPLMLFALIGFLPFSRKNKEISWAVGSTFLLGFYITSAWDIWWYGGSFGQRALVQSYALLLFPLAAFLQWISRSRWALAAFAFTALLLIGLNIMQVWQAHNQILVPDHMNRTYYWQIFGKTKISPEDKLLLDTNEQHTGPGSDRKTIFVNDFESQAPDSTLFLRFPPLSGKSCLYIKPGTEFSPVIEIPASGVPADRKWIRISGNYFSDKREIDMWQMPTIVIQFLDANGENVKYTSVRPHRMLDRNVWKPIEFELKVPESGYSLIRIYLYSPSKKHLLMLDDLRVTAFND